MSEREEATTSLPQELQSKLDFKIDSTGEFFIHDEFVRIGGGDLFEWIPARTRISKDGTKFEIGANKEDIKGLLALAKIVEPSAQNLEAVEDFWKGHKKVYVKDEGDNLYMGITIEPTTDAVEKEFNPLYFTWDTAVTGAIENKTLDEMRVDKNFKGRVNAVEEENRGGRTILFQKDFWEKITSSSCSTDEKEKDPIIITDKLIDFPMGLRMTRVNFAPGNLRIDEKIKKLKSASIEAYNGQPEVFIYDLEAHFDREKDEWTHDDLRLKLPIPPDLEIKKVGDIAQLKIAQLVNNKFEVEREMDVNVEAEDNSLKITSEDNTFEVEIRKPECKDCGIPNWKFPGGGPSHIASSSTGNFYQVNTSLGIVRYMTDENGEQNTYCGNCIDGVIEDYIEKHPFVSQPRAMEVARRRLDEAGYEGVEIWEDQVWHMGKGWSFQTKIEYERDGRNIIRFTGRPYLTDDGEFSLNMQPKEYVDFRYEEVSNPRID